jgi:hypothetical protein
MMCALAVYSQERALPQRRCAVPNPSATVHPTSLCLTGTNTFGELGTSNTVASSVPVAVVGGLFFTQVATGYQHSCGQMTTGAAMCWGEGWDKASCQSANARLASGSTEQEVRKKNITPTSSAMLQGGERRASLAPGPLQALRYLY